MYTGEVYTDCHSGVDKTRYISVPCGKCPDCRKKRAMEWSFRLTQEQRESYTGMFLTLTYRDEDLVYSVAAKEPELHFEHTQAFIKRLRRKASYMYKKKNQPDFRKYGRHAQVFEQRFQEMEGSKIRYYLVGEYGTQNGRPHYHMIVFNIPRPLKYELEKIWGHGRVDIGTVTAKSVRYVANYVMASGDQHEDKVQESARMSNGIGANYLEKAGYHRKQSLDKAATIRYNDFDIPMPKYYRDRFYIDEERELIADRNKNTYQAKLEAQKSAFPSDQAFAEYQRDERKIKWRNFYKHKKNRRL